MLQSMGSKRVGHDWMTEQQQTCSNYSTTTGSQVGKMVRLSGTQEKEREGKKSNLICKSSLCPGLLRSVELDCTQAGGESS